MPAQTSHSALYWSAASHSKIKKAPFLKILVHASPLSYRGRQSSANAPRILEHGAIPFQTQVWMHLVQQLVCIYSSSKKQQQAERLHWSLTSPSFFLQILACSVVAHSGLGSLMKRTTVTFLLLQHPLHCISNWQEEEELCCIAPHLFKLFLYALGFG